MQFPLFVVLLFCALFTRASCLPADAGWQIRKSDNQVKVYVREVDNTFEILAITQVESSPEAFLSLLRDTDKSPDWIHKASKVTLLEQPAPDQDLVHTVFDAPWPVQDRDMVTLSHIVRVPQSNEVKIRISDAGNQHPPAPDRVRMKNVSGLWRLLPQNTHTLICYQGSGDAAGSVPDWLSRSLLVSGTYNSFINLAKELEQRDSQNE
ncbi:START domain-containing protein [Lacimicrobium alkaliphilum]|uniref:START domain-containing protein n=1 Tax=Lacimicrobium alkaliphilum TaxID=1526571 RepID=A0ABQ1RQG4_9ALTE|nr:START domain-containing protein [Lacimicrobium alkaliphilum]GGD78016.1 hypothetical protein GCM10011357_36400 [Lacimicrobium alkaliphilum]